MSFSTLPLELTCLIICEVLSLEGIKKTLRLRRVSSKEKTVEDKLRKLLAHKIVETTLFATENIIFSLPDFNFEDEEAASEISKQCNNAFSARLVFSRCHTSNFNLRPICATIKATVAFLEAHFGPLSDTERLLYTYWLCESTAKRSSVEQVIPKTMVEAKFEPVTDLERLSRWAILAAVCAHDLGLVQRILHMRRSWSVRSYCSRAIVAALEFRELEILRVLIDEEGPVALRSHFNIFTAAAKCEDIKMVKLLFVSPEKVEPKQYIDLTFIAAIQYALWSRNEEVALLMMEYRRLSDPAHFLTRADWNFANFAMSMAAEKGLFGVIRYLEHHWKFAESNHSTFSGQSYPTTPHPALNIEGQRLHSLDQIFKWALSSYQ